MEGSRREGEMERAWSGQGVRRGYEQQVDEEERGGEWIKGNEEAV